MWIFKWENTPKHILSSSYWTNIQLYPIFIYQKDNVNVKWKIKSTTYIGLMWI